MHPCRDAKTIRHTHTHRRCGNTHVHQPIRPKTSPFPESVSLRSAMATLPHALPYSASHARSRVAGLRAQRGCWQPMSTVHKCMVAAGAGKAEKGLWRPQLKSRDARSGEMVRAAAAARAAHGRR